MGRRDKRTEKNEGITWETKGQEKQENKRRGRENVDKEAKDVESKNEMKREKEG